MVQNMNNEFYLGHKHRESTANVLIISYMISLSFHLPLLYIRLEENLRKWTTGKHAFHEKWCLVTIRCGYLYFFLTPGFLCYFLNTRVLSTHNLICYF